MQDFKSIADEVTDKNIYNLYSQAYALKCEKLLKDLCQHIIKNMLSIDSVAHFLQESIEFEIPELMEQTLKIIVANFRDIAAKTPEFLWSLPMKQFTSILSRDDLCIDHEFELVEFVKNCIHYHAKNGEKVPAAPEEVAGPEVWERLTDDERKARKTAYDKELKLIKDAETAQKKTDTAEFHKFTKLQIE